MCQSCIYANGSLKSILEIVSFRKCVIKMYNNNSLVVDEPMSKKYVTLRYSMCYFICYSGGQLCVPSRTIGTGLRDNVHSLAAGQVPW